QQIVNSPTALFDFNPATNTITPLDTPAMPADLQTALQNDLDFKFSMLVLPTGQVILDEGSDNHLFVYTPPGVFPAESSRPTVSGVADHGDGTFTLRGTQLNGISEGAAYGDDVQMSENYPLVRLTTQDGTVSYARTFDWSSTAVATGQTPQTTRFTLPQGLAA